MSDKPKNLSDIDNFWDLNSLLPQKRPIAVPSRYVNTEAVEVIAKSDSDRGAGSIPIPERSEQRRILDPYLIYTPKNKYISRVEISKWDSRYNFYENFRDDAKRLWSKNGEKCDRIPFFSYVPQYSQLKYPQLKWYLWWRTNVRHGEFEATDFCYVLLYIYEILNCPELICAKEGLRLLSDIWINYREAHPRLDAYLSEWICDYCLINQLEFPTELFYKLPARAFEGAAIREFYYTAGENRDEIIGMLYSASDYDYRKSRYAVGANAELFKKHIENAFVQVYQEVFANTNKKLQAVNPTYNMSCNTYENTAREYRLERSAYEGALCAYDIKRTIAVEYISYMRSPRFKFLVTDIVKYSENRIRIAIGVRARLKVVALDEAVRAPIDRYFDEHLPIPKKRRAVSEAEERERIEYEKLYEPATTEFNLDRAIQIEEKSWGTTEVLVSAFDDDGDFISETPKALPLKVPEKTEAPIDADEFCLFVSALGDLEKEALSGLLLGDEKAVEFAAKKSGTLTDAFADRINEAAFDIIGDGVIEMTEKGYHIINEYRGDLSKWLK